VAIALVQSTSKVVTGVNSTTLAFGSNLTAGNLAVVAHAHFHPGASPISTPTDTIGHTYAAAVAQQGSGNEKLRSYYVENVTGGANTVTFDMTDAGTGDLTCVVSEFSGAVTSGALGTATSSNTATGTSATTNATGTLDQADGMLWGAIMHTGANTTITQTGGASLVQENEGGSANMPIGTSYEITAATTGQAATWTLGASREYYAHVAFFKAAVGGGGGTVIPAAWMYYSRLRH
jgi:hypothetical protein